MIFMEQAITEIIEKMAFEDAYSDTCITGDKFRLQKIFSGYVYGFDEEFGEVTMRDVAVTIWATCKINLGHEWRWATVPEIEEFFKPFCDRARELRGNSKGAEILLREWNRKLEVNGKRVCISKQEQFCRLNA